ncbi:hypothetical protein ACTXT7_011808 [Hymenolepis weldensis]
MSPLPLSIKNPGLVTDMTAKNPTRSPLFRTSECDLSASPRSIAVGLPAMLDAMVLCPLWITPLDSIETENAGLYVE